MELKLKSDTAKRKRFFTAESFAHPAKCHLGLLEWIVFTFTSEGDLILDPMLGSGTTLYATLLGRSVIGVELENKFVKMAENNAKKLAQMPLYLGIKNRGTCQIIQGDARNLAGILVDKIVTSPPFFNTSLKKKFKSREELEEFARNTKLYKEGRSLEAIIRMIEKSWNAGEQVDKIITSPPYAEQPESSRTNHGILNHPDDCKCNFCRKNRGNKGEFQGYRQVDKCIFSPPFQETRPLSSHEPQEAYRPELKGDIKASHSVAKGQIGNLPYGEIDKIITSPPHGDAYSIREGGQVNPEYVERRKEALRKQGKGKLADSLRVEEYGSRNPDNLGNLPYGSIDAVIKPIDCVISSPPYTAFGASREGKKIRTGKSKIHKEKSLPTTYTKEQDKRNIGNLSYGKVDAVISSPPYEGSLQGEPSKERIEIRAKHFEETDIKQGRKLGSRHTPGRMKHLGIVGSGYSQSEDNIGNLKSTSYLEAMALVYSQCFKCLKDGGLMVLVTKNFLRNQKEIRLDSDTIQLCENAGFVLKERHYRKLTSQSFWRIIYKKKFPLAPVLDKEDVLVFVKNGDSGVVDKIITSPPFGEAHNQKDLGVGDKDRADLRDYSYLKSGTEGQIGDLPYGSIEEIK